MLDVESMVGQCGRRHARCVTLLRVGFSDLRRQRRLLGPRRARRVSAGANVDRGRRGRHGGGGGGGGGEGGGINVCGPRRRGREQRKVVELVVVVERKKQVVGGEIVGGDGVALSDSPVPVEEWLILSRALAGIVATAAAARVLMSSGRLRCADTLNAGRTLPWTGGEWRRSVGGGRGSRSRQRDDGVDWLPEGGCR